MGTSKYMATVRRLQGAIKEQFGVNLLLNARQWYSKEKDRAITVYTIRKVISCENRKTVSEELFQSYSTVQLALFLRDYWYELHGWEVPHDNEKWEAIKEKYAKRKEPTSQDSYWSE